MTLKEYLGLLIAWAVLMLALIWIYFHVRITVV